RRDSRRPSRRRTCLPADERWLRGSWGSSDAVALLQVLLVLDLVLDFEQPLEERLGPGRAARDVDVDRDDLVDALAHRVRVLEEPAAVGAAPHGDDEAGLRHLVVEALDPEGHLVGERPGDDEQVARPRARPGGGAEALEIAARAAGLHQLD